MGAEVVSRAEFELAIGEREGSLFLVYGSAGEPGRMVVVADVRARRLDHAYDLVHFGWPPGRGWFEQVTWARTAEGMLYVENAHATYASATNGRDAYLSAIDLAGKRLRWRSRALVANAGTFVISGDLIVSGYGFTAERDYLYLLDRRSGRVLDRLPLPSAPEVIRLYGDRIRVRTYDHDVVARLSR